MSANIEDKQPNQTTISEELRIQAHKLCREFLSGPWSCVSPSEINIEPVSGGLSNVLYCCTLPPSIISKQGPPTQILLRFYGGLSDDVTTESVIFMLLSERRLGPKLYGIFNGGRLEEYLAARPLTQKEMRTSQVSLAIARNIANIHSLEVPISKRPSWIFNRCKEWLDYIIQHVDPMETLNAIQDDAKREMVEKVLKVDFVEEIRWLREIISQTNSPVVFSHNDLLRGNILIHEESDKYKTLDDRLVFIDFEYCGYNYRGFDIASHFCEWCFDYSALQNESMGSLSLFPSQEEQRIFVREYLDHSRKISGRSLMSQTDFAGDSGMASPCNLSTNSSNDRSALRCISPLSTNGNNASDSKSPDVKTTKGRDYRSKRASEIDKETIIYQDNKYLNLKSLDYWKNRPTREYNSDLTDGCDSNYPSNNICNYSQPASMNQFRSYTTRPDEDLLVEEIEPFIQAAHLVWTLWAIKSACCSRIQFDYWRLASERLHFYFHAKNLYQSKPDN